MSDATDDAGPRPADGTISTEQACKLLDNITPQHLAKLSRDGVLPKVARGRWPLVPLVIAYIRYLKDENRASKKTAAQSRVQDIRVTEIQLKIEERSKALVAEALQSAMNLFDEAAGGLKADLLSIPARVTKDIPLRRKIENEVNDALGAASRRAYAAAERPDADGRPVGDAPARPTRRLGKAKSGVRTIKRRPGKA